jgi:hypothetical protein
MRIEKIKDQGKRSSVGNRLNALGNIEEGIRVEEEKHLVRLGSLRENKEEVLQYLAIDLGEAGVDLPKLEKRINLKERTIKGIDALG